MDNGQENGPKAEKDKTERARALGRRTREEIYIEKWDQTDSPEIPDRGGGTSETPGLPSWGSYSILFEPRGGVHTSVKALT